MATKEGSIFDEERADCREASYRNACNIDPLERLYVGGDGVLELLARNKIANDSRR